MGELTLGFADVQELVLTQLSGHLWSPRSPARAHVEVKLESFDEEDEPNATHLQLEVSVIEAEPSSGEVMFDGLVSYYVKLRDELPVSAVGKAGLFVLLWPYLRASMQDQAARFGHGRLSLPLSMSLDQLIEGEADANRDEDDRGAPPVG